MNIKLSECPEILQAECRKFLSERSDSKIICIDKFDYTPYVDKTVLETSYKVTVQNANTFTVLSYYQPAIGGVHIDTMTAGTIIDIFKNAEGDYFDSVREHL